MLSLLLCGASIALPLFVGADSCKDTGVQNETPAIGQPFAFNCTYPPITSREVCVTWYKYPSRTPISKNIESRIHQEEQWILFLPLKMGDSGIYQCFINDTNSCHRINVNLTVFEKYFCGTPRDSQLSLSDEYKQILHAGRDDSLTCHLNFPKSCFSDSIRWYKDCKELKGERFTSWKTKLLVNNVSTEDRGSYACQATLTHSTGKQYTVVNSITVNISEKLQYTGRIPEIIYPKNNSIEVQLGAPLIVDCNITDTRENTNLRCWTVNNTLVDIYYAESKRIREGIETHISFPRHNFYTMNITFSEVKMEDYGRPFTCHAGVSAAHFILKLPGGLQTPCVPSNGTLTVPSALIIHPLEASCRSIVSNLESSYNSIIIKNVQQNHLGNFPAPNLQAYMIGGLLTLTGVALCVMCIYNIFKIDIVLWYRSAFNSSGTLKEWMSSIKALKKAWRTNFTRSSKSSYNKGQTDSA